MKKLLFLILLVIATLGCEEMQKPVMNVIGDPVAMSEVTPPTESNNFVS